MLLLLLFVKTQQCVYLYARKTSILVSKRGNASPNHEITQAFS